MPRTQNNTLDKIQIGREIDEIIALAIKKVKERSKREKICPFPKNLGELRERHKEPLPTTSTAIFHKENVGDDSRRITLCDKLKDFLEHITWTGEGGYYGDFRGEEERHGELQLEPYFYQPGPYEEGWPGEGGVYSTFIPKDDPMDGTFQLEWSFGVNKDTAVHPLEDDNIFYSSSHLGIIYNYKEMTMRALVGHKNRISCVAEGGKYLVTADEGEKTPVLILWDSSTFQPISLWIQTPPGTLLLDISETGDYIHTITASQPTLVRRINLIEGLSVKGEIPSESKLPVDLTIVTTQSSSCIVTFPEQIYIISCERDELRPRRGSKLVTNKKVGKFRKSCTIKRDFKILTGTSRGQIIVWSNLGKYEKTVQLTKSDITWLQFVRETLVVSFDDGTISLYGQDLRLKSCCVHSLGIAKSVILNKNVRTSGLEFTLFTSRGAIASVSRKGDVQSISKGNGAILSMDRHPNAPFIVLGDELGQILLFDLNTKTCEFVKMVRPHQGITALAYGPDGDILLAGMQSGNILQLDPLNMKVTGEFIPAKASIQKICFSQNRKYFAYLYEGFGVGLYKHLLGWNFKGKYIGHCKKVTGMTFGDFHLYTVGEDRRLVKYDVRRGLKLVNITLIEQLAHPTSIIWIGGILIIPNSDTKIRIVDPETREILQTIQGPELSPITVMKVKDEKLVYAAGEFIGDFTISDYQCNTLTTAHPPAVSDFCICENFVCTIGRNNSVLLLWSIKDTYTLPPKRLSNFIDERIRYIFESGPIPRAELIEKLCYLGYFPSSFEANNIHREIVSDEIDEDSFRMIYRNYLPVQGLTVRDLYQALLNVCDLTRMSEPVVVVQRLMDALRSCEEPMTNDEVLRCLNILAEPSFVPPTIPIEIFINDVLGTPTALI